MSLHVPRQSIVTLDVEGVLTPEIWIALAEEFGIDALRRTTKDEPDYGLLMKGRLNELASHDITIHHIQDVIARLRPLDGARDFLDTLRSEIQVVLLSDTFEQFIGPLMAQLGHPTILCHRLQIHDDRIVDFMPRIPNQKRCAVESFRAMNYRVIAAGDSFNDLHMIDAAHHGFLFKAPAAIQAERNDLLAYETYAELLTAIRQATEITSGD